MSTSFSSDSPDAKKPCKGILKTSSSFDKHNPAHRKSAKFDELNVLQTYHPPGKDYGHMKIDEPKTPYNYQDPTLNDCDQLDAGALAEKLKVAADSTSPGDDNGEGGEDGARGRSYYTDEDGEESGGDEEKLPETDEQKDHREKFEKRRKAHYNEFEEIQRARKLIEEEDEEDTYDDDADLDSSKIIVVESSEIILPPELPGSASSMDTSPTAEDLPEVEVAVAVVAVDGDVSKEGNPSSASV